MPCHQRLIAGEIYLTVSEALRDINVGAAAFQIEIGAFASERLLGIATLPLETEGWVTRLMVVSLISFLSNRFGSQYLMSSHPVQ